MEVRTRVLTLIARANLKSHKNRQVSAMKYFSLTLAQNKMTQDKMERKEGTDYENMHESNNKERLE